MDLPTGGSGRDLNVMVAEDRAVTGLRTFLEDRTLHNELQGYADYARRVKYRLAPPIW